MRLIDLIYRIGELVALLRTRSNNNYNYDMYGYNYNAYYETEQEIEKVIEAVDDLKSEIENQLENEIEIGDLKELLNFMKHTIVEQLNKKYPRTWKKWEENLIHKSTYGKGLYDYFDTEVYGGTVYKPKTTPTKSTVATKYTSRPVKRLKYDVIVTREVSAFIKKMMMKFPNDEWGTAFSWVLDRDNKRIIIDRVYIMPVEVGGAHVKFINESEFIIFQDISELPQFVSEINKDNKDNRYAGMMHSHNTMGAFHSSVDHTTIDTYLNDFGSILSIVWAWKGGDSPLMADIILKTRKDAFLVDNITLEHEIKLGDEELNNIHNDLFDKYDNMMNIVEANYKKYKDLLALFDKTKKYIPISKLYQEMNTEDPDCKNIKTLKEIIDL